MSAPDAQLRANVRLLGDVLGNVLVEQEGDELLVLEERIRGLARDARETGESTELTAASGIAYVIEASAEQQDDEQLRVVVSEVRGPTESFVVAPDGTFVTEVTEI